ncbi:MAG: adenylate/guanylate cyclase domain-containing protein [Bdellovibrionota bacterium]|nr:adenylate/guanylate cyclase domain-containing protein [Bdellovibrionota bacterium]
MQNSLDEFDQAFSLEVMKSEIKRGLFLAFSFLFLTVGFFFTSIYFPERLPPRFFKNIGSLELKSFSLNLLFFFTLYEFFQTWVLKNYLKRNKNFPETFRYLSAFIEISFPTFSILVFSKVIDIPVYSLHLPQVFLYFIFILLSCLRLSPKLSLFTSVVAAIEFGILSNFLLKKSSSMDVANLFKDIIIITTKNFFLLLGGIIAAFLTIQIKKQLMKSLTALKEKEKILHMFGQHVSPKVVNKLLDQPKELTSELKNVCVLFLDIRNFTKFSESKNPEEVVNYLNNLFSPMIEIINEHNGFINKFLGDGLMAIFGAPLEDVHHAKNAVTASKALIQKTDELVKKGLIPPTRIGIGLHEGRVLTGNIGSSTRKEYTVIGEVVNLASRIEKLNKKFDSNILVSEKVWRLLKSEDGKSLGPTPIEGLKQKMEIFQIH